MTNSKELHYLIMFSVTLSFTSCSEGTNNIGPHKQNCDEIKHIYQIGYDKGHEAYSGGTPPYSCKECLNDELIEYGTFESDCYCQGFKDATKKKESKYK